MKTTVNNIASENVTSFVINEDMLNEKKAMKYISKPNMVAAINDICAAIKGLNSLFSPQEYTEANSKKELFDAYHRFYIIYTDLRDAAIEARHREEENLGVMGKPVTMTENRLAIRRAFLDGKINAVCGYPGIGKTYLTMIHPTFIDGFFSKQYYTDKKKGIVNPDFPENYARFCAEAMERGQIVVCAMHPKAREVFDSLGMSYLMIYPNENEQDRYFTIYDTRSDEREWIELNKSTWDTKIDSIRNAKIPTHCFKDEIPTGLNLTEYLEGLNIFDPEDLLNTLLRKIAVEPVPKEVQW